MHPGAGGADENDVVPSEAEAAGVRAAGDVAGRDEDGTTAAVLTESGNWDALEDDGIRSVVVVVRDRLRKRWSMVLMGAMPESTVIARLPFC